MVAQGIAQQTKVYKDLDCDFVVVDEREQRTAVRIRPQGEIGEPNCTAYTDREMLMGRGLFEVNYYNGILLDCHDATLRAVCSFPDDDINNCTSLTLLTKVGSPKIRQIVGRREELIEGL